MKYRLPLLVVAPVPSVAEMGCCLGMSRQVIDKIREIMAVKMSRKKVQ